MTLKYLIQKEFIQMRRNTLIPKLIVVFPLMIMLVIPWVMNLEVKNVVVDVVDNDHSTLSRRLTERIAASNYFIFNGVKDSYTDAMRDIEHCDADIILEIPQHTERRLATEQKAEVLIAANAVNGTKGGLGSGYLRRIVIQNMQEVLQLPNVQLTTTVQPRTLYLYNKHLNYKVYMIPALMALLILLLCGLLPALNIVGEKEAGTIEQINVTPVKKWQFILAKLIPYWLIAMVVMTECFLLSWLVYGIVSEGSMFWLYLLAILFALFFSGLGLVVSNYSDTLQQAIFVMWFFLMIMMIMSGLFTPTRSMPGWAQTIVMFNPAHYFIDAMRTVFVRGGGFLSIWHQLLTLALSAAIMGSWAVTSYRKNS